MTTNEFQIKTIEDTIKFIFNKEIITDDDVVIGSRLIDKWKKLTGWVERTEPVLITPEKNSYKFSSATN